jgi:anti-sigma regulatory factor (Ser/Thr protein kinase)
VPDSTNATDRQSFARSANCLPQIFEFMDGFFARAGIGDRYRMPMQLVVEEWFTNLVKYSRGGTPEILLELKREGGRLAMSLTEFNVERFDIRTVPDVNVDAEIRDRNPGGLGVHLLKRMIDDVAYEYVDGKSTTTFVKALE